MESHQDYSAYFHVIVFVLTVRRAYDYLKSTSSEGDSTSLDPELVNVESSHGCHTSHSDEMVQGAAEEMLLGQITSTMANPLFGCLAFNRCT